MRYLKRFFKEMLEDIFVNMTNRFCVQLRLFCIAFSVVAILMTVLNIFRGEFLLAIETGGGSILCIVIYFYTTRTKKYLAGSLIVSVIFLGLLTLFLTGGLVEGFAALWFCLYPFICFFILSLRPAALFSGIGCAILVLFLWTPLSRTLPPVYTENFCIRFPLLYIGNFIVALALNVFYVYTYMRHQQLRQKFEELSNQDGLTKLSNRTSLEKYKQNILDNGKIQLHALMLDVDFFKQYNDNYGHPAGDEVLISVADIIKQYTQSVNSKAVRYGGEEFLILLHEADWQEAVSYAEALRLKIYNLKIPHIAGDGWVSVSIGISSQMVGSEEDFNKLLKKADEALYAAKQKGRNCVSG